MKNEYYRNVGIKDFSFIKYDIDYKDDDFVVIRNLEGTVLAQTAGNVVHVQVSLNVASHEVRRIYQVCGANRSIAETQVRASETT